MGELFDDLNLKYCAYRNEILELIFLNTRGKKKFDKMSVATCIQGA